MKTLIRISGLAVIDFLAIWIFVYKMDPDPSVSIGILFLVPFVVLLNLIVAGILFLTKRKEFSKLFLINSVVAAILMLYLFDQGIARHQRNKLESWEFHKADTTFRLTRWKKTNEFVISYSLNQGSSTSFLEGSCELVDNEWNLSNDAIRMKISSNLLIGFRAPADTIKMTMIVR